MAALYVMIPVALLIVALAIWLFLGGGQRPI